MRNKNWLIICILIVSIGLGIYYFIKNQSNNKQSQNFTANKTEASLNISNNNFNSKNNNPPTNSYKNSNSENVSMDFSNKTSNEPSTSESEISTFTTKIISKDSNRQTNISITCSTLNDTFIKKGETFSFCNTVGQATTSKGYKKAEIFNAKRSKNLWSWWWQLSNKYNII